MPPRKIPLATFNSRTLKCQIIPGASTASAHLDPRHVQNRLNATIRAVLNLPTAAPFRICENNEAKAVEKDFVGEGRNRTKTSPTTSLNILIYEAILMPCLKGVQEVSATIRALPDLTRHSPAAYSVIEETVEGFVEGF